ncbi:DUF349 domain-containing protein, partial [Flavobacteriaceae bacterium]|nr:DUF349 domain-containing protein [Flavobacteriaceae bacterium]
MSEHDNLQDADGDHKNNTPQDESTVEKTTTKKKKPSKKNSNKVAPETAEKTTEVATDSAVEAVTKPIKKDPTEIGAETVVDSPAEDAEKSTKKAIIEADTSSTELDTATSEEASAEPNETTTPKAPATPYEDLSLETLISEFKRLLKTENIQTVRNAINDVKNNFNAKFSVLIAEKKEAFLAEGGNSIDFEFSSPLKKEFNALSKTFRERYQSFQKNKTEQLKQNLETRLQIIEEIKGLINVEGDIHSAYKTFKNLQERWRNTGQIPASENNNTWNNYRHHVEIFYGFLHLNRDLRDLDYKHNLEQKQKIIIRTEELAKETNLNRAFRELQALHKIWKEELGPVAKAYKDELWDRFSAATKVINDKRQSQLEEQFEKNLIVKKDLIAKIEAISEKSITSHKEWQANIKAV